MFGPNQLGLSALRIIGSRLASCIHYLSLKIALHVWFALLLEILRQIQGKELTRLEGRAVPSRVWSLSCVVVRGEVIGPRPSPWASVEGRGCVSS